MEYEYFIRVFTLLYADDTIVLAESPEELQKALDAVHRYCKTWKLTVNIAKTKIVVFSKGRIRRIPTFMCGENTRKLEVASEYFYLGTLFPSNNSMKPAVLRQIGQANRARLKCMAMTLHLSVDMQCDLFDKLITPVLLYGCEVWGLKYIKMIKLFHRKFISEAIT